MRSTATRSAMIVCALVTIAVIAFVRKGYAARTSGAQVVEHTYKLVSLQRAGGPELALNEAAVGGWHLVTVSFNTAFFER